LTVTVDFILYDCTKSDDFTVFVSFKWDMKACHVGSGEKTRSRWTDIGSRDKASGERIRVEVNRVDIGECGIFAGNIIPGIYRQSVNPGFCSP